MLIPLLTFSQKRPIGRKPIWGTYRYLSSDSLSGMSLSINYDHTYKYYVGGDLFTNHSDGTWVLKRDTLILNSTLSKGNIPIHVVEDVIDSIKNHIAIDWIGNADNDALIATLLFNGDSVKYCDPLIGFNCEVKVGSLDSIKLMLGDYAVSKWYKIRDRKTNRLKVIVPVHDLLAKYLFIENQKYLYRNGKLYPLPITQVTELDLRNGGTRKREVILQKERNGQNDAER